ncbi:MAG: SDR family NAD(P)-dependent oxidoreductase, partial [Acidimicrobiia bacterium]
MPSALVTGATSGIGRATAIALADAGWWVLATGRNEVEGRKVAAELEQRSGGAFIDADLSEPEAPSDLVSAVVDAT